MNLRDRSAPRPFRARRRAGQRGAAMVEGLVAIPVFMVIFASAVYIQNLYATKLKTMSDSRNSAWSNSMGACFAGKTVSISIGGATLEIPIPEPGALAAGQEAPGGLLCEAEFSESTMEYNAPVKMSDYMGGSVSNVGTSTKILCNEKPVAGDFKKGVDYLWNKYGTPPAPATPAPTGGTPAPSPTPAPTAPAPAPT